MISDPNPMVMEGCSRLRDILGWDPLLHLGLTSTAATAAATICRISGATVLPMQPQHTQLKPRTKTSPSSRRASLQMGLFQRAGVSMILNCRGRKGLLAIKSILLKAKSKGLSERPSGGLKTRAPEPFMAGSK